MKITNPNNLPEVLIRAAKGDYVRNPDIMRMSVTDLINPPLIRQLRLKHWDELEEPVDSLAWSLFGKAFHDLMQRYSSPLSVSEYKIEHFFAPYTLVGQPDVHTGGVLDDYKVTSVWAFLLGEKIEWEQQLNTYAWLLGKNNVTITELRIIAILRDWVKTKTVQPDYPVSAFHVVRVPLWTVNDQARFIGDRVKAHLNPVECTSAEKWQRDRKFAVIKPGVKRARRVLDTAKEAEDWAIANMKEKYTIEERLGERVRCVYYCPVRNFCQFNKIEVSNEEESTPS